MKNLKKQIFCIFDNKRVEMHFQDDSILQWKKQTMIYISSKGIKNTLSLQQIHGSGQLYNKFVKMLQHYNKYSIDANYLSLAQDTNLSRMSIKINEYRWQNPQIQQQKYGYQIKSDCGYASVLLHSNLYVVEITYMQFIRASNVYVSKVPNMTKVLLQKYNHQYAEFPTMIDSKEKPEFFYRKCTKLFNIFNVPDHWKYPLHLIWNSLIQYKVIDHQFCYLEYYSNQLCKTVPMPSVINPLKMSQAQNKDNANIEEQVAGLPILGKITHSDLCQFVMIKDCLSWLMGSINMLYDGYGFWFYNYSTIQYKRINKLDSDQEFHPKALPFTVRFKDEPERTIMQELKIFIAYCEENSKTVKAKQSKARTKDNNIFDNQNNLVCQQKIDNVGHFKAYSNGMIIVNFVDRSMMTLNSKKMEAKIIKSFGDTCYVDLSNTSSLSFQENKEYITCAVNFQQRVFFPQQWKDKQQISKGIEQAIQVSEIFLKTSSAYLKL